MDYIFSARDLFNEPHNYMYPSFGGTEFMTAWLRDRRLALSASMKRGFDSGERFEAIRQLAASLLACLEPGCRFQEICEDVLYKQSEPALEENAFDQAWPQTEAVLLILADHPAISFEDRFQPLVEGLRRRFEINKKLPMELRPPGMSLNRNPILSPQAYALMTELLAVRWARNRSARELNCLIKINDLLISQFRFNPHIEGMGARHFDAMNIGIIGELFAVADLLLEMVPNP